MPHSDIHGSKPARGSPWLFAACHVLHRLLTPRHPPDALKALDPPEIGSRSRSPDNSLSDNKDQQERLSRPRLPRKTRTSLNPGALTGNSDPQCQTSKPPPKEGEIHKIGPRPRARPPDPAPRPKNAPPEKRPAQSWWRRSDSNRRPEACKAPALPTELRPRISLESRQSRAARPWAARYRRRGAKLVGQGRLELPTSRLSSARSNQLSY